MDKHEFDDAIGASPPSTVDVDAIVVRQRRAVLYWRLGGPGVVAAAAVVAVTFGVTTALSFGGDTDGGAAGDLAPGRQPTPTQVQEQAREPAQKPALPPEKAVPGAPVGPDGKALAPASPPPTCTVPPDQAAIAAAATRLTTAVTAAVATQAPGITLSASPGAVYAGRQYGPLDFFHVPDPTDCALPNGYLLTYADATDAAGTGQLLVLVGRAVVATDRECGDPAVSPEQTHCAVETGPGGETVVMTTLALQDGPIVHRIDVAKPDGTHLVLQSQNGSGKSGPQTRPQPHLTHQQLMAIALDPALSLPI